MNYKDLFYTATESLGRNKSRSILTILGIVIGIAAVILMLAIGQSAQGFILGEVADLGSDFVFVEPSSGDPNSGPPSPFVQQTLDLDDVEALKESGIFTALSATLVSSYPVSHEQESKFAQIAGVDPDYLLAFPTDIDSGRFIDSTDVTSYGKVAVLGKTIAEDLFGDQDPIGMKIKIKKTSFRVIGVFAEQGTRFFQNLDQRIAIPVTTAQRDLFGVDYINFLVGRVKDDVELAKDEVKYILRDTHNIDNPTGDVSKDVFFVSSQSDAVETIGVIGSVLTIFLSSIAAISLVVGGIGIMNIMLVSVTERTREIGLRKAVGATAEEISRQFLVEAVLLTSLGGIIGIIFGVLLSAIAAYLIRQFVGTWDFIIPFSAIGLAAVVSTMVGLVFGFYPARRASRLDPIEALRYE